MPIHVLNKRCFHSCSLAAVAANLDGLLQQPGLDFQVRRHATLSHNSLCESMCDSLFLSEQEGIFRGSGFQRSEVRGQRSGVRGQGSGVRGQGSGVRGQGSEVRGQRSEVRGQRSEVRGQGSGVRGQRAEGRGQGEAQRCRGERERVSGRTSDSLTLAPTTGFTALSSRAQRWISLLPLCLPIKIERRWPSAIEHFPPAR